MTLTLHITSVDRLPNGEPTTMRLDRHGLTIGRSAHVDWSLPDPQHYVSSTHCEIRYKDGAYTLVDTSTNGTFVNGAESRLTAPHVLADGDMLLVGEYQIRAKLGDEAEARGAPAGASSAQKPFDWGAPAAPQAPAPASGWSAPQKPAAQDAAWGAPPAPASDSGWGAPPAAAPDSGWGASPEPAASAPSNSWASPNPNTGSAWAAPPAPASGPSAWSGMAADKQAPSGAADIWASMADLNKVDWDRGGFDRKPTTAADFINSPTDWGPGDSASWAAPPVSGAKPAAGPAPAAPPPVPHASGASWKIFLEAAGLTPGDLKAPHEELQANAGEMLRRLVGGMVVLMEARARAKSQMGAQGTMLEFSGNNPLKFARSPEKALAQLINPPERGFMPSEQAIEDAFRDLQAHQMATLAAMQGALNATLKRFSPEAIRGRAETRGLLAKILPSAREAALWQAYEREFEGVARGSDEAFMDVFAKEFRTAYERVAHEMKKKG